MFLAAIDDMLRRDDPVLLFAAVMTIILVAPLLFERLRVPGMVGLIAAGLLLGPHGVGFFEANETFALLATVGLIYLMFLAGLEINLNEFRNHRADSLVFGAATFLIPMAMGTFLSRLLMPGFTWPQAVLLASMFASHTLLSYPIASRLGLARQRAVVATVGGTILTDTAALLVLAVIAEMTRSQLTTLFMVRQGALLAIFVTLVLAGIPRLGYWFFRNIEADGAAEFIFVLAAVFTCSLGARLAGIEPIIGAFLAGLALGPLVPEQGVLRSRLNFTGHALFIPFFLLSVGMLVDPRIFLEGWGAWRVAGFMCGTVALAKWLAARTAVRLLRLDAAETGLIFGLSVNQAAATLAAVLVGREIGLFDAAVLNGTIMMILVTCVLGPWMTARHGRRVALRQTARPITPREPPERVLVAVRNAQTAKALTDVGLLLRSGHGGQPLYALHVAEEGGGDEAAGLDEAERVLTAAVVRGAAAGVSVQGLTRLATNPGAGLLRAARELRASLLVLGWSARSPLHAVIFHSLLDRMLVDTQATVVTCHCPHALATARRVLLAVPPLIERQEGFETGVQVAGRLAQRAGADLSVWATPPTEPALQTVLNRLKPKPETCLETRADWAGVIAALHQQVQPGDLFAVLGCRRGQLAWRPQLERLPAELVHAFPDHNLVVIFPPEGTAHSPPSESAPARPEGGMASAFEQILGACAQRAMVNQTCSLDALIGQLAHERFGDEQTGRHVLAALAAIDPVELTPGALLLHAHLTALRQPELLLGTGRITVRDNIAISAPVGVVAILLAPRDQSPEVHLRLLSGLARLVQRPGLVAALSQAQDRAAVRGALERKTAPHEPPVC